jgi:hypothetical protein
LKQLWHNCKLIYYAIIKKKIFEIRQAWKYTPIIPAMWEVEIEELLSEVDHRQNNDSIYGKQTKAKRPGCMAQVIKHLPTKCKGLSTQQKKSRII